jgi:hypothetical protein
VKPTGVGPVQGCLVQLSFQLGLSCATKVVVESVATTGTCA